MNKYFDTIVAPSTALVNQPIAIIRMSGPDAHDIINKVIDKPIIDFKNTNCVRWIKNNNENIDEVVILTYKHPHSFTSEDMIEINCHGGLVVVNKILRLLIANGCRMAENGEFSKRAFLNKKINLIQSEAIHNLIFANNDQSARLAVHNLRKKNNIVMYDIKKTVSDIIANIEVNIDYPEYDGVEEIKHDKILPQLYTIETKLKTIIKNSKVNKMINDGLKVLILGKPNVGKSSLLNSFLNENKAIVSKKKGTTRDVVEGNCQLENINLNFIDTAGIRKHKSIIEKEGILKALKLIKETDLILIVLDNNSKKLNPYELDLLDKTSNKNRLIILNKKDINNNDNLIQKYNLKNYVFASTINQDIDEVIEKISSMYKIKDFYKNDEPIITSINNIAKLEKSLLLVETIIEQTKKQIPLIALSIDLKELWILINEILGEDLNEDIIDFMFKNYCLGK